MGIERPFIQLADSDKHVVILNINEIVVVNQLPDDQWLVSLTAGKSVTLNKTDADKLFERLTGIKPPPKRPFVAG